MSKKRNEWLGDKETIVRAQSFHADIGDAPPVGIHVMHRRKKNPKTGKIHHYGWIHFSRTGSGVIEKVRDLRKLAHAILKSIGDIP